MMVFPPGGRKNHHACTMVFPLCCFGAWIFQAGNFDFKDLQTENEFGAEDIFGYFRSRTHFICKATPKLGFLTDVVWFVAIPGRLYHNIQSHMRAMFLFSEHFRDSLRVVKASGIAATTAKLTQLLQG